MSVNEGRPRGMHRTVISNLIASVVLLHVGADCFFHDATAAEDNCPPVCACSGDRVLVSPVQCECSHHPHEPTQSCNNSHCVFTKGDDHLKVKWVACSNSVSVDLRNLPAQRRDESLSVAPASSIARHMLFEVFLI